MARARRRKRKPPARDVTAERRDGDEPARSKALVAWLAGIAGAVLLAAFGVVFTEWYNAHGSDTIGQVSGAAPIIVGHVAIDYSERDTVLREPVTDPEDRAVMLATDPGTRRDAVLARHRMALIDSMNATVVLTGNRSSLRIVDIRPRILARMPVSEGAHLMAVRGGEEDTVELAADLDRSVPRFTDGEDTETSYFRKKQIDLVRDERITLSLGFTGKKAYYEFDLLVTALTGDRTEEVVIRAPDGGPFRLTGGAERYRAYYRMSPEGGWRPIPRQEICESSRSAGRC